MNISRFCTPQSSSERTRCRCTPILEFHSSMQRDCENQMLKSEAARMSYECLDGAFHEIDVAERRS